MSSATTFIIAGAIMLAIFFLIARLAIRWATRLSIIGLILIALIGVGAFWWWGNSLVSPSRSQSNQQRSTPAKRSPSR